MIFSRQWLGELVDLSDISNAQILSCLNAMGLKTEFSGEDLFSAEASSDRPDLHSMLGIARITAAALGKVLILPDCRIRESESSIFEHLDLDVPAGSCLRLSAAMAADCKNGPSPDWLRMRLLMQGLPSRNLLCDLAAYVRLETGLPVKLTERGLLPEGSLVIRDAFPGEQVPSEEETLTMDGGEPIVSDEDYRAIQPAGVSETSLSEDCPEICIFCGVYDPAVMTALSEKEEIPTETLKQNCLSLDPMQVMPALERTCRLLQELAGAQILSGTLDNLNYVPQPRFLPLFEDFSGEILTSLQTLGFSITGEGLQIPSFREDIQDPHDLIREISRLKTAFCR